MNETNVVATCSHRLGSCQRRPRRVAGPSDQTRPHEWRFYMNEFARWSSGEIWVARYLWTTVRCHDLSRSMTSVTNDLFAFASQMNLLTTVGSEKIGTHMEAIHPKAKWALKEISYLPRSLNWEINRLNCTVQCTYTLFNQLLLITEVNGSVMLTTTRVCQRDEEGPLLKAQLIVIRCKFDLHFMFVFVSRVFQHSFIHPNKLKPHFPIVKR